MNCKSVVFFRSTNSFLQSVFPLGLSRVPGNALSCQRCSCCPAVFALLAADQLAAPAGALGSRAPAASGQPREGVNTGIEAVEGIAAAGTW